MKNKTVDIAGLIVAVCTPFNESDAIDEPMFIRHLAFLAQRGVQRLLVNGTTGEFFSLTVDEKMRLLTVARKTFSGVLIFNATCDSLSQTRTLSQWGQEHGADAIAVLPPYYLANAPKQGVVDYLNNLAEAVSIPFIVYNFPKHTQNPLTPDMLTTIRHDGLKDSSADISLVPHTPRYLVGSDLNIIRAYQAGGHGFITARANGNPEPFVALEQVLGENDTGKIECLHNEIMAIARQLSGQNQIAMIKQAVAGKIPGYPQRVRLPLMPLHG